MLKCWNEQVLQGIAYSAPVAAATAVFIIYPFGLLGEKKNEKALEIFLLNKKKHPEDQFTPNVGLARCYTAMGEKKKAIKHWEVALQNIPENQKPNLAYYEGELRKLKEGDSEAGKQGQKILKIQTFFELYWFNI
eukprot:TRINITY_DN82278_c0_g1_i1.p3 TRINITY_DN82278_c0_g1~~TRINITY_DN82278_c0_g1_i1.p3  ORF type:complete len:135 (-),score=12.19 TRINITY_DN82278_c0_g1_i1:278-682(-)